MEHRKLKVNDFFCGCGGMGLAFMAAGFEIAGAWDYDRHAIKSYQENVGPHAKEADIREMGYTDIPPADVWAFGFPCQDLSVAGKQKGLVLKCQDCGEELEIDPEKYTEGGTFCPRCGSQNMKAASRSGMFFEMMRLLDETIENAPAAVPAVIIAENVKGLRPYLPVLQEEYKKRGYTAHIETFNSKWWGVPQSRDRYAVVGTLDRLGLEFSFPEEQHQRIPRLSDFLDEEVDEKYFIADEKAQEIIKQAMEKLEELGKCHPCITPDRVNKRQNGPRAKADEEPMFTLTAQDLHGVIVYTGNQEETDRGGQGETGTLNPNGCGKTLQTNPGGISDKEARTQKYLSEAVACGIIKKQRSDKNFYFGIAPTLMGTDYKGPFLTLTERKGT